MDLLHTALRQRLDEPELTLPSDDELAEADLQLSIGKGERRAREEAARALDVQLNGSGVRS